MPREGMIAILTGKKYCSHKKTADAFMGAVVFAWSGKFHDCLFRGIWKSVTIVVWKRIVNDSGKEEEKEQEWMKKIKETFVLTSEKIDVLSTQIGQVLLQCGYIWRDVLKIKQQMKHPLAIWTGKIKKRGSHKQKCGCLFFSYKMDEMPFKNSFPDKSISESRGIFLWSATHWR